MPSGYANRMKTTTERNATREIGYRFAPFGGKSTLSMPSAFNLARAAFASARVLNGPTWTRASIVAGARLNQPSLQLLGATRIGEHAGLQGIA